MQTKATVFFLSISIYLLGLFAYSSSSRANADTQVGPHLTTLEPAATTLEPAAVELAQLADTLVTFANLNRVRVNELGDFSIAWAKSVAPNADPLIVSTIHSFNDDIDRIEANELANLIEKTAHRYDVDPLLVTALISQESAFYIDAVSPVGALGLGQLMPYTADDLGVDPSVPAENLDGSVRYLAQNLDAWAHTSDPIGLALASYNAGPGAVSHYGGVPPYEETQHYVEIISSRYEDLHAKARSFG